MGQQTSHPQQITHPAHPNHVLSLLPRPTHTQAYLCDACGYQINDASAYQCRACNFDLHINCATLPMPMSVAHPSHPHRPNLAPVPNPTYQVPAGTQFATRPPLNNHPAASNYVNNTNRPSNIRPNVGNVLNHASVDLAYGTSLPAGYNFGQGLLGGGPNDGADGGANDGGDWNDWGNGGGPIDGGDGNDWGDGGDGGWDW